MPVVQLAAARRIDLVVISPLETQIAFDHGDSVPSPRRGWGWRRSPRYGMP